MSKTWRTDPVEKFGDVRSIEDQRRFRRKLPPNFGYPTRSEPTPELDVQREAERRFRIKRAG